MIPEPLFDTLLLVALLCLWLLLQIWWPNNPAVARQLPLKPVKTQRKRSNEPQPLTGLIHKPLCEACEQGVDSRLKAPAAAPPLLTCTRGRRRTVTTQH